MVGDDVASNRTSAFVSKDALKDKLAEIEKMAAAVKQQFEALGTDDEKSMRVNQTLSDVVEKEKSKIEHLLAKEETNGP